MSAQSVDSNRPICERLPVIALVEKALYDRYCSTFGALLFSRPSQPVATFLPSFCHSGFASLLFLNERMRSWRITMRNCAKIVRTSIRSILACRLLGSLHVICGGWLAFTLTGCSLMSSHFMNDSGIANYNKGNYTKARQEFQKAVADNPQNADFVSNLAASMRKQGDMPNAEWTYKHALNIDPTHQPSYHGLAELMVEQDRHAEANELLTTWANTQPRDASAHVEVAWLHRELGDPQRAETSLRRALTAEPNHPVALAHLGQLYHDIGQPAQAVAFYQRSLHSDWHQPQVQSRLAALQENDKPGLPTMAMASQPHPMMAARVSPYGPQWRNAMAGPPMMAQMQQQQIYLPQVASLPTYQAASTERQQQHVLMPQPQQALVPSPDSISTPMMAFDADPAHAPQLATAPAVAPF